MRAERREVRVTDETVYRGGRLNFYIKVWRDSKKPVLSAAPTPTKEEQKEGENEEVAEEEPSPVVDKKQTKKRGSRREVSIFIFPFCFSLHFTACSSSDL